MPEQEGKWGIGILESGFCQVFDSSNGVSPEYVHIFEGRFNDHVNAMEMAESIELLLDELDLSFVELQEFVDSQKEEKSL